MWIKEITKDIYTHYPPPFYKRQLNKWKLNFVEVERIHWKVGQKDAALLKKRRKISREESKYIKTGFSYTIWQFIRADPHIWKIPFQISL